MVAVLRSTQLGLVVLTRSNSAERSGDVAVSQARDVRAPRSATVIGRALTVALVALSTPGAAQTSAHVFPLRCSFGSKTAGLDVADACAVDTAQGLVLAPAIIARLAFDRGLASIAIEGGGWYYRTRDGRTMRMMTFDMGPDYFAQGLARAMIDGKLAYVDRRLRIRLRTRYDWGEPFSGGRANVCIGCVEVRTDRDEHSVMTGSRWGTIDRRGREIVPVRFRHPPPVPGSS